MMRAVLVLIVTAALMTSCKTSSPKQTKYIPKDSYVVFGFNSKSLLEKIGRANLNLDSLSKYFNDEGSDTTMIKKWNDLKNSGLDMDEEVYGFVKSSGSIMSGQSGSFGFVGALKDVTAFQAYMKKQNPSADVKNGGDYSYMPLGNDFIAGWNGDVVIVAAAHAGTSSPGSYSTGEGTLSQQLLTKLFAQKESESIASVKEFGDVVKENADMLFFVNSSSNPASSILNMTKVADLFKDSYASGTLNFEDGAVKVAFKSYSNKILSDIIKKYPSVGLDESMVTRYPSSDIDGFVNLSFNPQMLIELVKFGFCTAL